MRKLAWRLGWLVRSIDPLEGLEIGRANILHGATAQYVDPRTRDELIPGVKGVLRLPVKATLQHVLNAQETERQRRAGLATREPDRSLAWSNYPVPTENELWLVVDTVTGLPMKPEMHNERWHRVRAV